MRGENLKTSGKNANTHQSRRMQPKNGMQKKIDSV